MKGGKTAGQRRYFGPPLFMEGRALTRIPQEFVSLLRITLAAESDSSNSLLGERDEAFPDCAAGCCAGEVVVHCRPARLHSREWPPTATS
jgi:hypothetical protein